MMIKKILLISFLIHGVVFTQKSEARLMRYSEFPLAFQNATRVDSRTASVSAYYNRIISSLPKLGSISEFTDRLVLSQLGLAGFYCSEMIAADSALSPADRWVHQNVDFTLAVSSALRDEVLDDLLNQYSNLMWRRSIEIEELNAIKLSVRDYLKTIENNAASTSAALLLACSSMAGSFDFLWIN